MGPGGCGSRPRSRGRTQCIEFGTDVEGSQEGPLAAERPADFAYYTVTTEAGAEQPRIRAFVDWIEREAERETGRPGDDATA